MAEKYKSLKVKELQDLLQKRSLPLSGKKEELIERLVRDDDKKELEKLEREFELNADMDEVNTNDAALIDELLLPIGKEVVLSDDEDDLVIPLDDNKEQPETDEDKKSFSFTPVTFAAKQQEKVPSAADKLKLEAERRLQRSKRFGVKLGEQEMREIRAARFGTTTTTTPANEKKLTKEEVILKKRAERFGIPIVEKKTASEEEKEKKKAKKSNAADLTKVNKGRVTKQKQDVNLKKNVNKQQPARKNEIKKQAQAQPQKLQKVQPKKQQPQKQPAQSKKTQPQKQQQKAQPKQQQPKQQQPKQQQPKQQQPKQQQPKQQQPKQQQPKQQQPKQQQPKQQNTQSQKQKAQPKQPQKQTKPIVNNGRTVTIQTSEPVKNKKHVQMKTQANSVHVGNGRQVIIDTSNSKKRKNVPVEQTNAHKKRRWRS